MLDYKGNWLNPSHMVAFANNLSTWLHICANLRYMKQNRMISHHFCDINHGVLNLHKDDLNWLMNLNFSEFVVQKPDGFKQN